MDVAELRSRFLEFFIARDHLHLPSAPLVPNDPTLLFTSAGMVQFKEIFAGRAATRHPRATTCQKCFRTTDIGNVGKTAYHNTFFEMLGNFSFGDYFKQGAIELWWELLTGQLDIPANRLTAAVYEEDDEAYAIWQDVIGLPTERIVRLSKEHNWWGPVGDSGPCGPDSEIHYDAGEEHGCGPDCAGPACDCNRFNELGNIVFIQYNQQEDGQLVPLEHGCIDTGMGLERTSSILQGVPTVYDTDVFRPITEAIVAAMPRAFTDADTEHRNAIADHLRASVFLLADGVMPGNERQGYVFRRILRRAIRASGRLELANGTLPTFVDAVIASLGNVYPEIAGVGDLARKLIGREEETFRRTLHDGERRLTKLIDGLRASGETQLPGELAFELTDTYGFPREMTMEIAAEAGVSFDVEGFETALAAQRARSHGSATDTDGSDAVARDGEDQASTFAGYVETAIHARVVAAHPSARDDAQLDVTFDRTPFYAEAGGQVADTGVVKNTSREGRGQVVAVRKNAEGAFIHAIETVSGSFEPGDDCELRIDTHRRARIQRNHTATHLLHAALRRVLGTHVKQAGSVVNDSELRFDFSHFERLSPEQIAAVEDLANAAVLADHPVSINEVPLEEAQEMGAIGLFEDEYRGKELVRVVRVNGVSMELCGGTHVSRSGEIGLIKIVSEESIASGVRRLRAVTGDGVLERFRSLEATQTHWRKAIGEDPIESVRRLREELDEARSQLEAVAASQVSDVASDLLGAAEEIADVRVISGRVDLSGDQLKQLADSLEDRAKPAVILLAGDAGGSGIAVCKRSDSIAAVDAGSIIRTVSKALGGGGGGRKAFAQGGGPNVADLDAALDAGLNSIRDVLGG